MDLIEPVSKSRHQQWEAQSTEEVLRKIEETNTRLKEEGIKQVVIGSLDVEALYPSIDQVQGPRIVAQEIAKSLLTFETVDTHLLGVYLATVMSKERQEKEKVSHLLPTRKAAGKQGRKLTVHGQELGGPKRKEKTVDGKVRIGKRQDENEATEEK